MNKYRNITDLPHYLSGVAEKNGLALYLTILLALVIGFRPSKSYYFGDTRSYAGWYEIDVNGAFTWDWNAENFLFDNIFSLCATYQLPIECFFLLISLIYFGGIFIACVKIFPHDTLLALLVYLAAFSTFSYGTNGIKAGAAASIFLLALAYRQNKVIAALLLWASLGFHHAMLAPVVAYIIAYFYRNFKLYLLAWIICLLLAAAHVVFFQTFFSGFTDSHGAEYLIGDYYEKSVSGFRPDFILYSAVPIFLGYHLINKYQITSEFYKFIWCVYTLTNCVFLLCTYASFINRIAYLSWLISPFVLIYPFLNVKWHHDQKRFLRYVVYAHLGFTLFMIFFFYGI